MRLSELKYFVSLETGLYRALKLDNLIASDTGSLITIVRKKAEVAWKQKAN